MTWQNFQVDNTLCDMALACEDNQIMAHKVVIASGSPIFRNILKQN